MNSIVSDLSNISAFLELFFRSLDGTSGDPSPYLEDIADLELPGIRCPLCKWRPVRDDFWECCDCDHPEYFHGGCGTEWNTFETGGKCPTCAHQWTWTSCQNCWMWSKHNDWYETSD
jgi:hypothetical protein